MKIIVAVISIVALSFSFLAVSHDDKKSGRSYVLPPDGKLQEQSAQFIKLKFQKYKVDGLILFQGSCRWIENDKPAIVPVKLFDKDEVNKKLMPRALYYTREDGKFYFATEDNDDIDYVIGPVTSQAKKMPAKVRKFFEEYEKEKQQEAVH